MDGRLRTELMAVLEEFFERQDPARAPLARPLIPDRELQMAAAALMVCVVRADQASRQMSVTVTTMAVSTPLRTSTAVGSESASVDALSSGRTL